MALLVPALFLVRIIVAGFVHKGGEIVSLLDQLAAPVSPAGNAVAGPK